ncbi:hypothetical protein [Streptomyces sp. GC420]|uniref:hypothetical protein n=1 Tax=Streptomyces sp. GC420 TaxID=2697568 RepID=UPI001AA1D26E|nr:hypothetical protein [Streptomyces sp. GC420]
MTAPDCLPLHTIAEDNLAAASPDLLRGSGGLHCLKGDLVAELVEPAHQASALPGAGVLVVAGGFALGR